ncbi:MAG: uncharacterized protein JWP62_1424, partial [Blastococcus sp.]|nr:uncharacterized protein [Blastococcus sp.]
MAEKGPSFPPPLASSRRDPAGGPLSREERGVRRDAVGELGSALRDLVDAAVRTEVPLPELAEAAGLARELAARLRGETRTLHEIASVDDPETGERWYSPVYGPGNPVAPPLVVTAAAD